MTVDELVAALDDWPHDAHVMIYDPATDTARPLAHVGRGATAADRTLVAWPLLVPTAGASVIVEVEAPVALPPTVGE